VYFDVQKLFPSNAWKAHGEKISSVFGGHVVSMNITYRK
jgi:hypothetical protein